MDESTVQSYAKVWLECVSIRSISRKLQTFRELKELFRKILLILSIEPGTAYMDPVNLSSGLSNSLSRGLSNSLSRGLSNKLGNLEEEETEKSLATKNWSKVKVYLSQLRSKSAIKEGKSSEDLIAMIFILLDIPVEITSIFTLLKTREKTFDQKTKLFMLIKELNQSAKESILANEILPAFQLLFKSNRYELKYLTDNYNGMAKHKLGYQISIIKSIIETFVHEIVQEHRPLHNKLMALDNLKWIFKGRESEIVQSIDI